jgi:hypothetical protein
MVANAERGEVQISVVRTDKEGHTSERPYILKMSMNAAAVVQSRTKKTIGQLLSDAITLDFVALRDIVWLLLQKHHKDEFKTAEAAGDFIDEAGGVEVFFTKLQELGQINMEAITQHVNGSGDGNPQTADGTLPDSSATPVGSA